MREDLIGTIVEERYRIEQVLGAGAMGCVYRARHTRIGREVAIKILRDDLVREPALVERFAREARIAARLRHPNLVSVLDVGENLMVMELAAGRCLADLAGAPLPRARVIGLVAQLLRGLEHAHAAGLVHRDLKPENILVERHADGTETARIVDFGIAVLRDRDATSAEGRRLTDAGLVVGTPLYMSPEQATGKAVDHRTDLFSLGVIVYELLAGVTPFHGTGAEVAYANVTRDPPLIAERVRGVAVDPLLEAFARKLMARRREERFASAHDALAALELIDRNREDAARLLDLFRGPAEPSGPVRVPNDSDALATLPMTDTADLVARHPRWRVGAIAVAAVALVVGWALVRGRLIEASEPATSAQAALAPTPVIVERPETPAPQARVGVFTPAQPTAPASAQPAVVAAPQPAVLASAQPAVVAAPQAAVRASAQHAVVTTPQAAVRASAQHGVVAAPQAAVLASARPAVARVAAPVERVAPSVETPAVAPVATSPAVDESAAAVAARYHAVGNALHARGTDVLWQQYRRIQLGEAMATADSRHAALTALDAIERALPAS
jgi:serine/threonine-protein kinase